ncbi:hypothetical protein ABNN70_05755 [Sporolactobacillus sp. Y61]|uniref:Type II secretion system protein GspE N-terminal domain-containing protein n=1 Tax=Sporolactobacillus sp. Y61 TaxID=3160863 RepID=A0AAU8IHZ3_9BACL
MSLFRRKADQIGQLQEAIVTKARQIRQLKRRALDETQRLDQHLQELQEAIEAAYLRIEQALHQDPQKQMLIKEQLHTRMDPCPRMGEHLLLLGMITARQLMNSLREQKRSGGKLGEILVRLGYVGRDRLQSVIDQSGRRPLIGELLVQSGHVKRKDLDRALTRQESAGGMLGDMLLSMNLISPAQLADALAVQGHMKRLTGYDRQEVIRSKLPEKAARKFKAIVIRQSAGQCVVAAENALSATQIHELGRIVASPVTQVLASSQEMERLWTLAYASDWLRESTEKLRTEQPENSASQTFSRYRSSG